MKRNTRLLIVGILVGPHFVLLSHEPIIHSAVDRQSELSREQSGNLSAPGRQALYDADPNHIWNRLYRSLYIRATRDGREYGYDELDPLLWPATRHLLSGHSHQNAIKLLDEFLSGRAERLITHPLKRALFQRDLWAIFDWSTQTAYEDSSQRRALQIKLAQAIRRLALPKEEIQKLPNNYADAIASKAFATKYDPDRPAVAFLPPDLFQADGSWVPLSLHGGEPIALTHIFGFSGRSVFLVFMRLLGSREETLAYIKKAQDFPQPWVQDPTDSERRLPNPKLPQFPVGTQLALVRQMVLIDNQGSLTPTNLIEKAQIRAHRAISATIPEGFDLDSDGPGLSLDTFEFKLSHEKLLAGIAGGLRAATRDDKEFPLFQSHGVDLFEEPPERGPLERRLRPVLRTCVACHFRPGIHSVLSHRRKLTSSWDPQYEANSVIFWKHRRYDWGLLKGLWELQPTTSSR